MNYKRIGKATARKCFREGCDILLLPCKVNDSAIDGSHPWVKPITINIETCKHIDSKFDMSVYDYEYYNCNAELGYYAHYFISIDDYIKCKSVLR